MTGNSNKVRAVFLAMLMVFSVFAGTVAFSGSAVAVEPTYDGNAVHYANSSGAVIEVPFTDGNVDINTVNNNTLTILDDGDNVSHEYVTGFSKQSGAVLIEMNQTVASDDLEIEIGSGLQSGAGDSVSNPGEKAVAFAGQTAEFTVAAGAGAGTFDSPDNFTSYQGTTVAINVTDQGDLGNVDVTVEGEDNSHFAEGNTGPNSSVFTFDTSDRELGEYKVYVNGSDTAGNRTFITVRDLGLDISLEAVNV
jgi:surface glycoprotein (TIGR04207 family)